MQPLEPDKIYKLTQVLTSNRRELFLLIYREILLAVKRCDRFLDRGDESEFWPVYKHLFGLLDELTKSVDAQFEDINVDLFKLHQYYFNRAAYHRDVNYFDSPAMRCDLLEMRKTFTLLYKLFASNNWN